MLKRADCSTHVLYVQCKESKKTRARNAVKVIHSCCDVRHLQMVHLILLVLAIEALTAETSGIHDYGSVCWCIIFVPNPI